MHSTTLPLCTGTSFAWTRRCWSRALIGKPAEGFLSSFLSCFDGKDRYPQPRQASHGGPFPYCWWLVVNLSLDSPEVKGQYKGKKGNMRTRSFLASLHTAQREITASAGQWTWRLSVSQFSSRTAVCSRPMSPRLVSRQFLWQQRRTAVTSRVFGTTRSTDPDHPVILVSSRRSRGLQNRRKLTCTVAQGCQLLSVSPWTWTMSI